MQCVQLLAARDNVTALEMALKEREQEGEDLRVRAAQMEIHVSAYGELQASS